MTEVDISEQLGVSHADTNEIRNHLYKRFMEAEDMKEFIGNVLHDITHDIPMQCNFGYRSNIILAGFMIGRVTERNNRLSDPGNQMNEMINQLFKKLMED